MKMGKAILELCEDEFAAIIHHLQDMGNTAAPCTITLKVKVVPDKNRESFALAINSSSTLSPREPVGTTVFRAVDNDGVTGIEQYDPRQGRLPLGAETPV